MIAFVSFHKVKGNNLLYHFLFFFFYLRLPDAQGYFKVTIWWEMSVNSELSEILLQAEADLERFLRTEHYNNYGH